MVVHAYIYKLSIIGDEAYYFGSTTTAIEKRFKSHISDSRTKSCSPYTYFKEKGIENLRIEVVEELYCDTTTQILLRENYYIIKNFQDKRCLNTKLAIVTPEIKHEIDSFKLKLRMNRNLTIKNKSHVKQGIASPINIIETFPYWKIPDNPPVKLWKERVDLDKITI